MYGYNGNEFSTGFTWIICIGLIMGGIVVCLIIDAYTARRQDLLERQMDKEMPERLQRFKLEGFKEGAELARSLVNVRHED